jgi:hypothetical protein
LLLAGMLGVPARGQEKQEERARKSGAVVGVLTAKGQAWIEVKADGEEKARRYVPNWVGAGPPEGGPDKAVVKVINGLKVGSRLRVEWQFDERPRVVKIEVLRRPADKDETNEATKKGTVAGQLTAKTKNWIEVKADGEERGRRYFFHRGGTPELRQMIEETAVGSRVQLDWIFIERPRVVQLEVLKAADKER